MFSNAQEVLAFIKDEDVKFIDIRFCDLPGIMQHFNVPAASFDEDAFNTGQMFDGSSIRGFQEIQESDMLLVPDPGTAVLDPFRTHPTLILNCFVKDPVTGEGGGLTLVELADGVTEDEVREKTEPELTSAL